MKKNIKISPVGLKGREINERMKSLMGIQPINENKSNIVIELTKMGPDGNAYAIVRENHEWYIKKANKSTGLIAEDFKYIGGLMNKKNEAYPSYSKAIKHLNLKFKSLAEAYNFEGEINVFENDNLLSEEVAGYSEMKGNGFSGEGNLEENKPMFEEEVDESVEMTDEEEAVDEMLTTEVRGPWSYNKNDTDDIINNNGDDDDDTEYVDDEDDGYHGNNLYTKNKFKTDQQFYDFIKDLNDYGVDFENNNDSIKIKNNFKRAYGLYLDALEFTEDDFREHGFSESDDDDDTDFRMMGDMNESSLLNSEVDVTIHSYNTRDGIAIFEISSKNPPYESEMYKVKVTDNSQGYAGSYGDHEAHEDPYFEEDITIEPIKPMDVPQEFIELMKKEIAKDSEENWRERNASDDADRADYMRDYERDERAIGGMNESRFSIDSAIKNMDRLIENLTEGLKKKV